MKDPRTIANTKVNKTYIGHIAHLKKQFKPINKFAHSYVYIIKLNWRGENHLLFDNKMFHTC